MSKPIPEIRVRPIRAFADNYIWVIESMAAPGRAIVVDPGDATPIDADFRAQGIELAGILLTHHHPDHIGGVAGLIARAPVPVFGPNDSRMPAGTQAVGDGSVIEFSEMRLSFETWALPGHTASHVGYVGHGALFCGDTLFSAGCGRLFEGSPEEMNASLTRLADLPPETRVYCAHEYTAANLAFALAVDPSNDAARRYDAAVAERRAAGTPSLPSTIELERRVNPFLRCATPAVRAAVESHAGHALARSVEVFTELRRWKDGFR